MFLNFYGLSEQPFGVTPDPEYLYLSATHREALASVAYGIQAGVGFAAVIAKPGMGKTTLLFSLLRHFRNSAQSAFLFDTQCNSKELLQHLLAEFKIQQEESGKSDASTLVCLRQFLLRSARANQRVLVVVDEAQNLDIPVFETLRLLSNFETSHAKLLHIVLAGQPELGRKLALPELEQLRQRITIVSRLDILTPVDVINYVVHRLKRAGYRGGHLFTPEALGTLVDKSHGVPREINRLCFNAMSLGCALGKKLIDGHIVREAAADVDFDSLLNQEGTVHGRGVVESADALAAVFSKALETPAPAKVEGERVTLEQKLPQAAGATPVAREREPRSPTPAERIPERPKAEMLNLQAKHAAGAPSSRASRRSGYRLMAWPWVLTVVFASFSGGVIWFSDLSGARVLTSEFVWATRKSAGQWFRPPEPTFASAAEKNPSSFNSGVSETTLADSPASPPSDSALTSAPTSGNDSAPGAIASSDAAPEVLGGNTPGLLNVRATAKPTRNAVRLAALAGKDVSASLKATTTALRGPAVEAPTDSNAAAGPASQNLIDRIKPAAPETRLAATLIKRVDPKYPKLASSQGISGEVVLNAHIDQTGKVQEVQTISGDPVLVGAAVDAVRQWEYRPSLVNGQPRQSDVRILITFSRE